MNSQVLIQTIQQELETKGFKSTSENKAFIETLINALIEHIQSQAVIEVTTTGSATAQSGIGKII